MNNEEITIIKKAIILEKQGCRFYQDSEISASTPGLKTIFGRMAEEEIQHEKMLQKQLKQISGESEISSSKPIADAEGFADAVITQEIIDSISGTSSEAAAISAAMSMELSSSNFYSEQCKEAATQQVADLFKMLSEWESSHLRVLSELNRNILEKALNEEIY